MLAVLIIQLVFFFFNRRRQKTNNEQLLHLLITSKTFNSALKTDFNKPHNMHYRGFPTYEPIESAFTSLCKYLKRIDETRARAAQNKTTICRLDLPAIHGTPGLGKSTFLDEFARLLVEWKNGKKRDALLSELPDCLQSCVVVCVTYNNQSIFNPEKEKDLNSSETLALRVLWSYFYKDEEGLPKYSSFCKTFVPLFRKSFGKLPKLHDAISVLKLHQSQILQSPVNNVRILLLIDELLKFRGVSALDAPQKRRNVLNDAVEFAKSICSSMDKFNGLFVVLTSLDQLLKERLKTQSGRIVQWVKLHALSQVQCSRLLAPIKAMASKENDPKQRTRK